MMLANTISLRDRSSQTRYRALRCAAALLATVVGCKDVSSPIPPGTVAPGAVQNAAGAQGMYVATRVIFQQSLADYAVVSGMLTDELQSQGRGQVTFSSDPLLLLDARFDATSSGLSNLLGDVYAELHAIRQNASQARGALAQYDAANSAGRRAVLYAWQGYAEVMLADLFCSGVPLSTFDYGGDFTYGPSLSTDALYRHAIAVFDSARIVAPDSTDAVQLARIGIARAQLSLAEYASAADSVHSIPAEWVVSESIKSCSIFTPACDGRNGANPRMSLPLLASVANRDGGTGLPFLTSLDPRTAATTQFRTIDGPVGQISISVSVPNKYPSDVISPFVVANGIEARLVEAEADLRNGGTAWLGILNTLRTNGTFTTSVRRDTFGDSVGVDTLWNPGTGGVAGLAPLRDPGATPAEARLSVLFAERASWLFLTGHRQEDLRRLVRRDHRAKSTVYPTGAYPLIGTNGQFIDLRIPDGERQNPQFQGCLSRD